MNRIYSSTFRNDLLETVQSAIASKGIVNFSVVAEEIRKRNEAENIALKTWSNWYWKLRQTSGPPSSSTVQKWTPIDTYLCDGRMSRRRSMPFPGIAYPDDLSVMQEVIEGYCLANNIADETGRDEVARLVMMIFEGGATTAEEIRAGLNRLERTTLAGSFRAAG